MTWALCFSCGHIKHGAICPCPKCAIRSTGDTEIDILFSDHFMALSTLKQFGQVVNIINKHTDNNEERFWTFLYYISETHSDILKVDLPAPIAPQIQRLYPELEFPPVEVLPGIRNRDDTKAETVEPKAEGKAEEAKPEKKWWQFW